MKNIKFKKGLASISLITLGLLTACGKNDNKKEVLNEKVVTTTQSTTIEPKTEQTIEKTDSFIPGDLDINNNYSIENEVDSIFEENSNWFIDHGMDKDSIRDIIFVLNDKYTDENGNLIIDEDRALNAYYNVELILGNAGSAILQKMDNINTIELEPERSSEINNDWDIIKFPSLTRFIDSDIAGGMATIEKISEFEELRDYEISVINETGSYDRERINDFVRNMEIGDYNSNQDNMDNVTKKGQKYVLAAYKNAALQFASHANPQTIYIEGYSDISDNIKINATNEERFIENDIITMIEAGLLDANVVNTMVSELSKTEGLSYTLEEKELLEKYAVNSDELKLIMSYVHYLTTMAYHKYEVDMCNIESQTIDKIKENNVSLNDHNTKKIVLC